MGLLEAILGLRLLPGLDPGPMRLVTSQGVARMPADMSVTQQFHTSAVVDVYPGMLVWEAGVTRVATADDCARVCRSRSRSRATSEPRSNRASTRPTSPCHRSASWLSNTG